jgi:hypothetical protein
MFEKNVMKLFNCKLAEQEFMGDRDRGRYGYGSAILREHDRKLHFDTTPTRSKIKALCSLLSSRGSVVSVVRNVKGRYIPEQVPLTIICAKQGPMC